MHGDLNPSNLLRRDQDGLPVLLDFGLLQRQGEKPIPGATAGFASQAQGRLEAAAAWMDLHALGVTALVLLSGSRPEQLLDAQAGAWVIPEGLDLDASFREALGRLLSERPEKRFEQASAALEALRGVVMPESTGPIARAERTLVLAPWHRSRLSRWDDGVSEAGGALGRRRLRVNRRLSRAAHGAGAPPGR